MVGFTTNERAVIDAEVERLEGAEAGEILRWVDARFGDSAVIASSFGAEDVVLIDLAMRHAPRVPVFTLDTGRLPPETYEVMEAVRLRYGLRFETYAPERADLERLETEHGFFSFRGSVEARKACCGVRKVRGLERALAGRRAWVTGLRREQAPTRAGLSLVEIERPSGRIKVNPLAAWSEEQVWRYVAEHDLPYSPLYERGFRSIGCAPCTRATLPGDDVRAGRWWWEVPEQKECGLHPAQTTALYTLRCVGCGKEVPDDGSALICPEPHPPALLRTEYASTRLQLREVDGVARYADWLPARRPIRHDGLGAVYRAESLGETLGLERLWVAFSGHWPERGATLRTGSFKEFEAPVVCARLADDPRTLVVASAGNTGRAFAEVCSDLRRPLVLVVPEGAIGALWSTRPFAPEVRLVMIGGGADYLDAIRVADRLAALPGFVAEGGVRNVARRDGLAIPVLEAAFVIGAIPHHYVQAVGSGSGAIAAWEASARLRRDGRFGDTTMRLHLAQNAPFTPMVDAWTAGTRELAPIDEADGRERIRQLIAPVLSNRCPPYAITGGVYDALVDTGGRMYAIDNDAAARAARTLAETEGIDVDPAAAVAAAALCRAIADGAILPSERVLLHLTGGGRDGLASTPLHHLAPSLRLDLGDLDAERVAARLNALQTPEGVSR